MVLLPQLLSGWDCRPPPLCPAKGLLFADGFSYSPTVPKGISVYPFLPTLVLGWASRAWHMLNVPSTTELPSVLLLRMESYSLLDCTSAFVVSQQLCFPPVHFLATPLNTFCCFLCLPRSFCCNVLGSLYFSDAFLLCHKMSKDLNLCHHVRKGELEFTIDFVKNNYIILWAKVMTGDW